MRRTVFLILFGLTAVAAPACDGTAGPGVPATSPTTPGPETHSSASVIVPPGNSRSVSVPSPISPAKLRHKTCEDLLPTLREIRDKSGQDGVDRAVADTIAGYPGTADWSVFSPEQQDAAINGAHDAATGTCSP